MTKKKGLFLSVEHVATNQLLKTWRINTPIQKIQVQPSYVPSANLWIGIGFKVGADR